MKKLFLLFGMTLVLAACGNDTEEIHSEETHETHDENEAHHHEHVLDINLTVDNESEPSVINVELLEEDEAYEADRVRFEVENPETEEITWLNAESKGNGLYSVETAGVEPGKYSITAHINGPDELHEHTDDVFEIK